MNTYEIHEGDLLVSTDKALLDRPFIHEFLSGRSYWAKDIPLGTMNRSIENSLCFGVYRAGRQVGFARVVTDHATFAWLADVFIVESGRAQGLGKKLISIILAHPQLQGLRRFMLGTRDAHGLYAKYGFAPLEHADRFMQIKDSKPYGIGA